MYYCILMAHSMQRVRLFPQAKAEEKSNQEANWSRNGHDSIEAEGGDQGALKKG